MYTVLLILHLLICLALIGVVLMQSGKGGGLAGGAFGGSAQTVFGGRGATDFVTRATMILGGAFFVTSLVLALMTTGFGQGGARSLIQSEAQQQQQAPPTAAPGVPTPPSGAGGEGAGQATPPAQTPPAGGQQPSQPEGGSGP